MKNKNRSILKKIKNLIPTYSQEKYIIGNIDKNSYVQFVPEIKWYHLDNNKKICVFYLEKIDLRKKLICPTCGKNLML